MGGNEVNVLATFPVGIAAYAVAALAFGAGPAAVAAATGAAVAFSLAFYRSSRGVYFALDYLLDPVADDATPPRDDRRGGDGGAGGPDDGRGGDAGPRRAARPATADVAAETFVPVSTAPVPPATTVSR